MAYTQEQRTSHIREFQHYLYGIACTRGDLPRHIPDGIFDESCEAAVRAFQRAYGLQETGEVNTATWEKLTQVYQEMLSQTPQPLYVFRHPLREGDAGFAVLAVQGLLQEYGCSPEITGRYDADTAAAVMRFQHMALLPPTGVVDCATWNALATGDPPA
ncbi:MAG: peptidoglycan-binding protein [Oscillospiraceae bacterium]|nr:peptidoglycan-binding protein [Oscillospiraceae bacterium]